MTRKQWALGDHVRGAELGAASPLGPPHLTVALGASPPDLGARTRCVRDSPLSSNPPGTVGGFPDPSGRAVPSGPEPGGHQVRTPELFLNGVLVFLTGALSEHCGRAHCGLCLPSRFY